MEYTQDSYWLTDARIPLCLLPESLDLRTYLTTDRDGLAVCDLEIIDGSIQSISAPGTASPSSDRPLVSQHHGMVLPCFVDIHTHLDKGQIWNRSPNPNGTFAAALETSHLDRAAWSYEDLYRRMEFGLKCSYAHGTQAIRTHLDCPPEQVDVSLKVFRELQDVWRDRLHLQVVSLTRVEVFLEPEGEKLADRMASLGGVLGGVAHMNPMLGEQLDRVFALAKERNLDVDIHADENLNPDSQTLFQIARAALRNDYRDRAICGHCCSLSVQPLELIEKTLMLVREAGIGIVSLPTCNLYLQDRAPERTPRYRGITLLHELRSHDIPVAIASDNCRDPFFSFGDHDGLEIFNQAARIAHLDRPYGNWIDTITSTPAQLMGLSHTGKIAIASPANLILFKARNYSELLARPQSDRVVLRHGKAIDTRLPDYAELDDLMP